MAIRLQSARDIRKWRKQLGLSQEALARLADVSLFTVSRWERGKGGGPSKLVLLGLGRLFEDYQKGKEK